MKILIILTALMFNTAQAEEIISQGDLEPVAPLVQARGTLKLVQENDGSQTIYFSEDYFMSSGIVLDLKLCGLALENSSPVCLSQGEVRKLKGTYQMKVRFRLLSYEEIRVSDIDLSQEHARAQLH